MAKSVIFTADDEMIMVVIPSNYWVSGTELRDVTNAQHVELAHEEDFKKMFSGCEVGAIPPFGHLFDMDVYMDEKLLEAEDIVFSAGNHSQLIQMSLSGQHLETTKITKHF